MRRYSKVGLWAIAKVWYAFFGVVALSMLGTAWQAKDGFRDLFESFRGMKLMG
jgi:hypothetical protein